MITAALGQLLSKTSQNPTINSAHTMNDNKVSIVSAPKNVKFIIPFGQSGGTSNESTFGVIESSTRTITHVKDIFSVNSLSQSQMTPNQESETVITSLSSNSLATASSFNTEQQQEMMKSDSEEIPLLSNENFSDK